jgi:hypothetical protein
MNSELSLEQDQTVSGCRNVRYTTKLFRRREMTQWAMNRHAPLGY